MGLIKLKKRFLDLMSFASGNAFRNPFFNDGNIFRHQFVGSPRNAQKLTHFSNGTRSGKGIDDRFGLEIFDEFDPCFKIFGRRVNTFAWIEKAILDVGVCMASEEFMFLPPLSTETNIGRC